MKLRAHRPKPLLPKPSIAEPVLPEMVQVPAELWNAILKYLMARPFLEVADCLTALRSLGLAGRPQERPRRPEAAAPAVAKE